MSTPMLWTWTGDAMEPMKRFQKACDAEFVIGEVYRLEEVKERSRRSHSHYFASVHNGWMNLSEDEAERFPTAEHLRKHCLIHCGYRNERTLVASTKAEALRIAAFMRPANEYAIIVVRECTVVELTAKSQSQKAMGAKEFQESKTAVLDMIASIIGTDAATLKNNEAA